MIPKTIHYCWFGGAPKPKLAERCIASWRKYFPDYEIREWNERNFDVDAIPYTRDAYAAGKFAYVSDYARFWVLYHHGGLYFDTDVEAVRDMADIVAHGAFMGWGRPDVRGVSSVEPGLGLGAEPGMELYREILVRYASLNLYDAEGRLSPYTMIPMLTDMFTAQGLHCDGTRQVLGGVTIYPAEFFCPMDPQTGRIELTDNTRTIHRYTMSWLSPQQRIRAMLMRWVRRLASLRGDNAGTQK